MSDQTALVEAPDVSTNTIAPKDKKDAAFLMPAKEDVAGFTCHAFAKSRKGFVIATGNELLDTEKHLTAYKETHTGWKAEVETPKMREDLSLKLQEAHKIEDVDKRAKTIADITEEHEGHLEWQLMTIAVPDFMFHLTALAYLCVSSAAEVSRLVGRSKDHFHEKVVEWGEALTDEQWDKLTIRAFQELVESNIGNDFKVKDEEHSANPGAPAPKN